MKNIYELSKEFSEGLVPLYERNGLKELCREMRDRFNKMKDSILVAWFAEHGFAPGKAVLVEECNGTEYKVYIRESTAEETERALKAHNKRITPALDELNKFIDLLQWSVHPKAMKHLRGIVKRLNALQK
jgi:hypothetical protein